MVIFGVPVVPDVGPSSATSSAAVATSVNSPLLAAQRATRSVPVLPPMASTGTSSPAASARSSRNRLSHRAAAGRVSSSRVRISLARSAGMMVTTTAPALSTPSQAATSHGLFGDAQHHAVPGDDPEVLHEDLGHLVGAALQFPVAPGRCRRG